MSVIHCNEMYFQSKDLQVIAIIHYSCMCYCYAKHCISSHLSYTHFEKHYSTLQRSKVLIRTEW